GSARRRCRGADVCRARPARDHTGCKCHRHDDPASDIGPNGRKCMSTGDLAHPHGFGDNTGLDPFRDVDFSELEKDVMRPRTLTTVLLSALVSVMCLLALIPLFSVVLMLLWRGGHKLSVAALTELPPAPLESGGGFGNAIIGTLIMITLATLISTPIGILSAVYLSQTDKDNRFGGAVRFSAKVLTGFPSVLAGVFAYGTVVLLTGGFSAIAGSIALSIL